MAHYLITGGTGLIGSALCRKLIAEQHRVTVLTRSLSKVAKNCGPGVNAVSSLQDIADNEVFDAVINLAGEPIFDHLWTAARKRKLEQSRIALTRQLVDWISQRTHKPECLISGSAVGWYGDGGDQRLTEDSPAHDEYTHQLCQQWEQQAQCPSESGVRVCIVRTGLVLSAHGGMLSRMLLPFKLYLGGRFGDGRQYMSWIHIDDMVKVLMFLAENKQTSGVFNATAPNPVSNAEFTASLARQLKVKACLPVPALPLKWMMGEMSRLLLTGQRVVPQQLQAVGFRFKFSELDAALVDVVSPKE